MEELTACYGITGNLKDAASFFQNLIDEDPYSHIAWYNLGDVNCRLGLYDESLRAFDYCILIREDYMQAYLDQAHVLALTGQYESAIKRYKQTFDYYKPDAITYFNLAECYEKLEQMEDARLYYKKAVKQLPQLAQAWYGIALTLEYEDRWYEAIHYVRKALEKDNENGEYWLLLGDCEYNLNNFIEAEKCYKKVIEDDPGLIEGWMSYAHFLTETGRPEEACEMTNKGLTIHADSAELNFRQVANLYASGKVKESYSLLETSLDKGGENISFLFNLLPQIRDDKNLLSIISSKRFKP